MAVASIAQAHFPGRVIVGVDTHKDSPSGTPKTASAATSVTSRSRPQLAATRPCWHGHRVSAKSQLSVSRGRAAMASDSPDTSRVRASSYSR